MVAHPSLYEVLGVPPDATPRQIRQAYRLAARRTHPDAGGQAPAFARVGVAYRVLGDPESRRRYDRRLAEQSQQRAGAPMPTSSYPPNGPSASGPATAPGPGTASRPSTASRSAASSHPLSPGADPVVRRRYFILMGIALALFISGGAIVRLYSLPAAMIMMVVAAVIPPIAVTVASRPRWRPDPTDRPPTGR